ncbi:MAG: hypothetical protein Q4C71_05450 [Microbacteriaceae bacterium]|nr:hypothetical protein [Microbacteriaceae bacterium]
MNAKKRNGEVQPVFSTDSVLVPRVHNLNGHAVEVTYLGRSTDSKNTWILWNAQEPFLIGLLRQGKMGYVFEQRTSAGPILHENLASQYVHKMIGAAARWR